MSNPLPIVPFVDLSLQHQRIQAEIAQQVQSILVQGDFILGRAVSDFENAFAAACQVPFGVGVASGTDAITLGLKACGIGPGDEVLLPVNTFIATLIGVIQAGATPVFVDCDPATALMDLKAAEKAITPKTRAIVPVHLYGQMVSPKQLLNLASSYDLLIFEDAAQAHMAEREGYRAGSVGIAAAFSFYPSKNLGAIGDGGMVVTQDEIVAQTLRSMRNYGSPRKYLHTDYGVNSRLDTLQAAVLQLKLPYLSEWNQARYEAAQLYDELLQPLQRQGILPIQNQSSTGHIYHLYVVRITPACPLDRTSIQESLTAAGVQTGIHYPIPCHLQPAFTSLGYTAGDFPQAEALAHEILSLPMYPGMTAEQVKRVVAAVESAVSRAELTSTDLVEKTLDHSATTSRVSDMPQSLPVGSL